MFLVRKDSRALRAYSFFTSSVRVDVLTKSRVSSGYLAKEAQPLQSQTPGP